MGMSWYLRLVGVVRVSNTADAWEAHAVGSRKARTLLALLGSQRDRAVPMTDVVTALWEDAPPREPEANVATLVSRLRGRFGQDTIVGGRRGYQLGDSVHVDLHEAATCVLKAERLLKEAQPAHGLLIAEKAMRLLDDGPVLTDHRTASWAEQARDVQKSLLRRSRHVAAECSLRTSAPRLAQVLAETLVASDPLDEPAYRVLMRACVLANQPTRAVAAYQRLRMTLASSSRGPDQASRDLLCQILRPEVGHATG